jgi:Mce-associated membrane protein
MQNTKPHPADNQIDDDSEAAPLKAEAANNTSDEPEAVAAEPEQRETPGSSSRQLLISVRSLVIAAVIALLVCAVAVLAWLYVGAQNRLDKQAQQAQSEARAEQVALDYAVNAAAMDFKDMNAWKAKLVAGTSPELAEKLGDAATSMEQILVPLQWTSSAQPLTAKVRSHVDGVYVVDSFVSVLTKTTQAPEGLQSTATYSVTINRDNNWQITDVGGIGAVLQQK